MPEANYGQWVHHAVAPVLWYSILAVWQEERVAAHRMGGRGVARAPLRCREARMEPKDNG